MKRLLLYILLFASFAGAAQTPTRYPLRYDTTVFEKIGGNAELILKNGTRNRAGAFLQNRNDGRTQFAYAMDSTFFVGDTLKGRRGDGIFVIGVLGSGPGAGISYSFSGPLQQTGSVVSLPGWNKPKWDSTYDWWKSNPLGAYYTSNQINQYFAGTLAMPGYNKQLWDSQSAAINVIQNNYVSRGHFDSLVNAGATNGYVFKNGLYYNSLTHEVGAMYDKAYWNAGSIQGKYVEPIFPNGGFLGFDSIQNRLRFMRPDSVNYASLSQRIDSLGFIAQYPLMGSSGATVLVKDTAFIDPVKVARWDSAAEFTEHFSESVGVTHQELEDSTNNLKTAINNVLANFSNYYTKTESNDLFYPLDLNPKGYLTRDSLGGLALGSGETYNTNDTLTESRNVLVGDVNSLNFDLGSTANLKLNAYEDGSLEYKQGAFGGDYSYLYTGNRAVYLQGRAGSYYSSLEVDPGAFHHGIKLVASDIASGDSSEVNLSPYYSEINYHNKTTNDFHRIGVNSLGVLLQSSDSSFLFDRNVPVAPSGVTYENLVTVQETIGGTIYHRIYKAPGSTSSGGGGITSESDPVWTDEKSGYATTANLATTNSNVSAKLNTSDTAAMLNAYRLKNIAQDASISGNATALSGKVNTSDTATMLNPYRLSMISQGAAIATKYGPTDTVSTLATQYDLTQLTETNKLAEYTGTSTPTAPASGVTLFSYKRGGRNTATSIAADGSVINYQPSLFSRKVTYLVPTLGATTVGGFGAATSATGTPGAPAVASSNYYVSQSKTIYVTTATAGTSAGLRVTAGAYTGQYGYFYSVRFSLHATGATTRGFAGQALTTSVFANADPSSNTNIVGVGWDAGETTLSIMTNDGTGTATKVSLGASFPTNTQTTDVYELRLYQKAGTSSIGYSVERLNTGDISEGTLTTDIPALTTLMAPQLWINNGTTAELNTIGFLQFYFENF